MDASGGDGTVTVDVAAGVATDAGGNGNTEADQHEVMVDTTAPSVSITASDAASGGNVIADDATTNVDTLYYTVTFTEAVDDFAAADITLGGTAKASGGSALAVSDFAASGTEGKVWTFKVDASGGDGTVTVDIAANVATDAGGNGNTEADQHQVTVDTAAPSVTIEASDAASGGNVIADAATTNVDTLYYTVTFDEAVTGFAAADITVGGTAKAAGGAALAVSDFAASGSSNTTWTFKVDASGADGTVTVEIAAGVATDAGGNGNSPADQHQITVDTAAPSVTITARTASGTGGTAIDDDSTTNATTLYYTVTFTEAVSDFVATDITLGGTAKGAWRSRRLRCRTSPPRARRTRPGRSTSTPRGATAR